MAAPAAVLSVLVKANTGPATSALMKFNTSLGSTEKGSQRAAKAVSGLVKNVALVGAGGTVAGLAYATKKAADFEQQLSSLGAVSDANGRQMDRFRRQALKAGADTKFSALEAAQAQTELAKGGLAVKQIMGGGLKSSLALAAAGEMDLAEAAASTVNAMKLFGIRGRDSIKVADAFATAANSTTADVADFAIALRQGGSAAKASGLSFRDTIVFLESLAEAGIKGSDAGTSMKAALAQLAKPTDEAGALMKKLGIDLFDAHGNMKSLDEVSKELRSGLGGLTREQRLQAATTLAGTDGMRGLLAVYDAGPEKIRKLQREQEKQGTAADVARKKQDNLRGSLEQLHGSFETLGIQVGTLMIPAIRKGADELTDFTNKLGRIASDKDLSVGEKIAKAFDLAKVEAQPWIDKLKDAIDKANIPEKLGDAISAAAPVVAGAVAKLAKGAAGGFIRGFVEADVWGRLAIGGWLLARMGGLSAFRKAGGSAGGAMAQGMASGVGSGPASAGIAAGLVGKLKSALKTAGKGALAAGLLNGVAEGIKVSKEDLNFDQKFSQVAHGLTFGLLGSDVTKNLEKEFERLSGMIRKFGADPGNGFKWDEVIDRQGLTDAQKTALHDLVAFQRDVKEVTDDLNSRGITIKIDDADVLAKANNVVSALERMEQGTSGSLSSLRTNVRLNMRAISKAMDVDSAEGKEALSANFWAAISNVKNSMDAGLISVKSGTREIKRLMLKALGEFGITGKEADRYIHDTDTKTGKPLVGGAGMQRGGHINVGASSGDSVPAMLERGEYVLNRNAVQRVGRDKLDQLNFGAAARFQAGGIVGLGRQLQRLGYHVGEHPAFGGVHGHAPNSYHYRGMAIDVNADDWPGGEPAALDKLYRRLRRMPGIVELLWRVKDHFDHLHVAMGAGAAAELDVPTLKRIHSGVPGAPGGLADRALAVTRNAAQDIVNRAAGMLGFEGAEPDGASGGYGKTALKRLWTKAGGSPKVANLMAAIALAESGGNPKAKNPSGASGLWQILGVPFPGDPFDPLTNARMAVAKYQTQGLGAWEAYTRGMHRQFLQAGGHVGFDGVTRKTTARRPEPKDRVLKLDQLRKRLRANFDIAFPTAGMAAFTKLVGEHGLSEQYTEQLDQLGRLHDLTDEEKFQTIIETLQDGSEVSRQVLNKDGYRDERGHFIGGINQHLAETMEEWQKAQQIEDTFQAAISSIPKLKADIDAGIAEREERMQLLSQFARLEVSRRKNIEETLRKLDEKQIKTAADKRKAVTDAAEAADHDKDGLRDQISNLQAQKGVVKTQAERTRLNKEIQQRRDQIDNVDDRLRKLRRDGGSADAVRLHKFALREDLRGVKATLEHWVGTSSNDAAQRGAWQKRSVGGDLRDEVRDRWRTSLQTLTDAATELPGKKFDAFINRERLRLDYEDWRDTPAPKEPPVGPSSGASNLQALTDLLREANIRTKAIADVQARVLNAFPQLGGGGTNLSGVVALATGGRIKQSGWAVVGERGPELAHLPGGARVYSHRDSQGMLAGSDPQMLKLLGSIDAQLREAHQREAQRDARDAQTVGAISANSSVILQAFTEVVNRQMGVTLGLGGQQLKSSPGQSGSLRSA